MIKYQNFQVICQNLVNNPNSWYAQAQTVDGTVIFEPTFGNSQFQAIKYSLLELLKIEALKRSDAVAICLDNEPVYFNLIARIHPEKIPTLIDGDTWVEEVLISQEKQRLVVETNTQGQKTFMFSQKVD